MTKKQKKRLRIAGCYIVKNEATTLMKSMRSLAGQVDLLLVADTGSTDGTPRMASAAGAHVLPFAWCDDFAAARNFVLDALQGCDIDWVVFLDADEYFTKETRDHLREVVTRADAAGTDLLLVPWHNYDTDTGEHIIDLYAPRIFRLRDGLRYAGRIHETLTDGGESVKKESIVGPEMLTLVHTGYSTHLMRAKGERNLKLLLEELETTKHPERLYGALAETYDGLDEEPHALRYAYLDIAQGRQLTTYASRSYRILLRRLAAKHGAAEERCNVAASAVDVFPEIPEFHAEYAMCLAQSFDFVNAQREAQAALAAYAMPPGVEPVTFDDAMRDDLARRMKLWRAMEEAQAKLRISTCLVARDEAHDMPLWLEKTEPFSDERVIVDTGSRDATTMLALAAGAQVLPFVWCDDFAAARNEALSVAQGDWIVFLDADETFVTPSRVRGFLAETVVLHPEAEAVRVLITNVDEDDGGREMQRFVNVRLFRNHAGLRYAGRVHENVVRADGTPPVMVTETTRLCVRHTGYSRRRMVEKARRNLALLLQEPPSAQTDRYLADAYLSLGDPARALSYVERALRATDGTVHMANDLYYFRLQCLQMLSRPAEEQLAVAREAAEKFPDLPEFPAWMGGCLRLMGNVDGAFDAIERACALFEAGGVWESSHFGDMIGFAMRERAALAYEMDDLQAAFTYVVQALEYNPYDAEALNLYRTLGVLVELPAEKQAQELRSFLPAGEDSLRFLLRWAEQNGWLAMYAALASLLRARYGKMAPRLPLYEDVDSGKASSVATHAISSLSAALPRLVEVLLRLERQEGNESFVLTTRCKRLLPPAVASLWAAYSGATADATLSDTAPSFGASDYMTVLPYFLANGTDAQVTRYALLSTSLGSETEARVADALSKAERFSCVAALLGQRVDAADEMDAAMWRHLGIAMFRLKEYESAQECFAQVEALSGETEELRSYRTWILEARAKGGAER